MTIKTGYMTTEFWLSLFGTIASLLVALGAPVHVNDQALQTLAGAAALIIPVVYTAARSVLKMHTVSMMAGEPSTLLQPPVPVGTVVASEPVVVTPQPVAAA